MIEDVAASDKILFAEGYATVVTLPELRGVPVVVTFESGNIPYMQVQVLGILAHGTDSLVFPQAQPGTKGSLNISLIAHGWEIPRIFINRHLDNSL